MTNQALPLDLGETVRRALAEDIGSGDITAQLVASDTLAHAQVISREPAVLCGTDWFDEVFRQLDNQVQIIWQVRDGASINTNQILCDLKGPVRALLEGERTALNFLQLLSATATQTQQYVKAVSDTNVKILDTRKTLPGLRLAQKYAVRCGGGNNHRMGLYDAFLIKENHIIAAGSIVQAIAAARRYAPYLQVEVEVETLEQINEAITADILLLDNFSISELDKAVTLVQDQVKLEASGGVTLETIHAIAATGVNFISVGAITKNIQAIDLSMRMQTEKWQQ